MKELRSITKGPGPLLLKYPLNIVHQVDSIPWPTPRQSQAVQKFFDSCDVKLNRIISEPEKIDGLSSMPEVAFMGRSNVGKSSLLNALLYPQTADKQAAEKKEFARVANHPGFTKTLNFYTCGRQVRVVDMPGYGYGSKTDQGNLIRTYLENQRALKRVYLLASCKEGLTELDDMALNILTEFGIPWQLVFTKLDKLITKPEKVNQNNNNDKRQEKLSLLDKLKSKPVGKQYTEALSLKDTELINKVVATGLPQVEEYPSVFEQVIGTSATKRLNFLGVGTLRTSIFQACGLLRKP